MSDMIAGIVIGVGITVLAAYALFLPWFQRKLEWNEKSFLEGYQLGGYDALESVATISDKSVPELSSSVRTLATAWRKYKVPDG